MQAPRTRTRGRISIFVALAISFAGLQAFTASPATADVTTSIAVFPYSQDWSNAGLIAANNDWTGVQGTQGYRGDDLAGATVAGNDPQAVTADGSAVTNVLANQTTPDTVNTGAVGEFEAAYQTIALQGSGTADAPQVVFHLDLTGKTNVQFSYDAKDIDAAATDNAVQPIAVQYRVGSSGAYTNLPAGFIADATTGPSLATLVTHKDVPLPAAVEGSNDVYVRVLTVNAVGNDEWVGIDNIAVTTAGGPLAATNPGNKIFTQNQAITPFNMAATGGTSPYTWSDPTSSLPAGLSVNAAGQVSGTPTGTGVSNVTLRATDAASATSDVSFTITVNAPGALVATNPGNKSGTVGTPITNFTMAATGGTSPYTWSDPTSSLPPGVSVASGGLVSGTPTTANTYNVTLRVTDAASATNDVSFTFTVGAALTVKTIAELQGTGARSTYAGAGTAQGTETVITEGVITGLWNKGFATSGAASCGLCGFTIQSAGSGGPTDSTPGTSDGLFVYGFSTFSSTNSTGGALAVGQSVRVTGKISEFSVSGDTTGSLTELNLTTGTGASVVDIATLTPAPIPMTALPATVNDREAHESETVSPAADEVVITDVYNYETSGELGLATGGKPLVQPTEICADDDTACIATAQADIKNRGWFLDDGSTTAYLTSSTFYNPSASNNSDIPLPYMDATHSARVGAAVTFPAGKPGVISYGNKKWQLNPQRAIQSTPEGTPDLGADVITIEDTRPANAAPAPVGGNLKIATYNVENFFNITMQEFAAANPYYTCDYDKDRNGNNILAFECNSAQAIPSTFDPVTGAPTAYSSGLVSAPRGAGRPVDLDRQAGKIVKAINGLGADIVSLEELENPNKLRTGVTNGPLNPDPDKADSGFGTPIPWRDETINYLVGKLNIDAGGDVWSFVASPEESTDATSVNHMCATVQPNGSPVLPPQTNGTCSWASGQDVIRSGFLYKKATVVPVGPSDIDFPNSSAPVPSPFDNAREPLAQFFKPVGHPKSDGFAVIVNHFKSKGDSDPAATGGNANSANGGLTGAFNLARTQQATELVRFANEFADKWNTTKVFLVGDFNSYTKEDPIEAIVNPAPGTDDLDFDVVTSSDPNDLTYVFTATVDGVGYGGAGSLDHVLGSADARAMITGTDVWEINSNEAGSFNYSRFNTNATNFFNVNVPYAGSDHNPEIIGINTGGAANRRDIQIIGSNDFHGRLVASTSDGGAAQLSGAVKSLKATYGAANSTFVAAGDLIGASTFESFIDKDKPTLKALNAAGLEFSSVGNHEFDQGVGDLVNRVMKPESAGNPDGIPGGLQWQYLASNVKWTTDPDGAGPINVGDTIAVPRAIKDFGGGIKVGFIGAVTEDLPNLVAPSALTGVAVSPIASAVNAQANLLVAEDADVIVLLVHEGAPSTDCATMQSGGGSFATLLGALAPNIDAVISGHTHLEYSCNFTVPEWAAKPITKRPVLSAGQYGVALDQLVYSFDTTTGIPVEVTSNNVGVKGPGSTLFSFPEDPAVKSIVDDAVAAAAVPGAVVLGKIAGPFKRARLSGGVTENRGGESTLGNLVAEIQRAQTPVGGTIAAAQIAFMNPGGLRDDLNGAGASFPKDVTYKAAAGVQPFANTLVNMDLTGAQIKAVLEQQWQRDNLGNVPSRPFLRLGTSKGFTYNYTEATDPAHSPAKLGTVTSMWLNGVKITNAGVYSVTMNSFLASGGDNFRAFLDGTDKRDTGVSDLKAQVDYFAANAQPTPLAVDYGQHAVRVTFPGGAPASYGTGDTVAFNLASLSMTGPGDTQDSTIKVTLNGSDVQTGIPVTTTLSSNPDDEAGTASVSFTLPAGVPGGEQKLHIIGNQTGTDVIVPIQVTVVEPATRDIQIIGTNDFHGRIAKDPTSAAAGAGVMAGAVNQLRTANPDTVFAAAGDLIGASTFESFIQNDKPTIDALNAAGLDVSSVGNHEFDQGYSDLVDRVMAPYNATTNPKGGATWQYLGANVRFKANDNPALPATWTKDFGSVRVGFVGTVTEHLPELVSPGGISTIKVTDIVAETNAAATDLKTNQGADLVIMLVHEGAPNTNCGQIGALAPSTDFGKIVQGVNANVDAIVSGHTHLAYNCSFSVPDWVTQGRTVTERPVVSAGQYGANLNKLVFTVNTTTGAVTAKSQALLGLKTCSAGTACGGSGQPAWVEAYPTDSAVQAGVDAAVAQSDTLGNVPVGQIAGPIKRGYLADGSTENRGVESSLGNLVAEAQKWQTSGAEAGGAQIAFMNPGGLRADMLGTGTTYPRTLTFKQAAVVQPFANGLVNMKLTGTQIKNALEQQWQPGGASRPFLKLGISKGFTYTSDPDAASGSHITGMWLDGVAIVPATVYSVTVNSFLSTGGDNFTSFAGGTNKAEAGLTDLQAMVNYLDEFANSSEGDPPLAVPTKQNGVHVNFPNPAPAEYPSGTDATFDVTGWSFTSAPVDTEIVTKLGTTTVDTAPVDNTVQAALPGFDATGAATVTPHIPGDTPVGTAQLTLTGPTTGTEVFVPVTVGEGQELVADDVSGTYGAVIPVVVTLLGNHGTPTGTVELFDGLTSLGQAPLVGGTATIPLAAKSLPAGTKTLNAVYTSGDAEYDNDDIDVDVTVNKAATTVTADDKSVALGQDTTVHVVVTSPAGGDVPGTVEIFDGATSLGSAALTGGAADVPVDSDALAVGPHTLTAKYATTTNFLADEDDLVLTVQKAATSVSVANAAMTYGKTAVVTATVTPSSATGTVTFKRGATVLGTSPVSGGVAQFTLPAKSLLPGVSTLSAEYSGSATLAESTDSFTVSVAKAASTVTIKISPKKVKKNQTKAKVKITVSAVGVVPGGQVKVKAKGQKAVTVTLDAAGKATVKLDTFGSLGDKSVKVKYLGTSLVLANSAKTKLTVIG
jgi:5'-nucleotidase